MCSQKKSANLLVADDDVVIRKLIEYNFESAGLFCSIFQDGDELLEHLSEDTQACLLDLKMPGKDGFECLKHIKKNFPQVEVVILTNVNKAAEALDAVRSGAFDYITKPFDPGELIRVVRRALKLGGQQKENLELRGNLTNSVSKKEILGESPAIKRVNKLIDRIAPTNNTVLLTGESGTGKTLIAHSIHLHSNRSKGPFVAVSCPSLPADLLESEMFGHEKGAFSGALQKRLGRAELANGGTLFLDEIGEMHLSLQAKLLTFLQEKTFFRVGGEKSIKSDVRIITATNKNLEQQVKEKAFREDLFFRLNVIPLEMPPLRERKEDIPVLIKIFLETCSQQENCQIPTIAQEVIKMLQQQPWTGNIRELENCVIRAFTLRTHEDHLQSNDFSFSGQTLGSDENPKHSALQKEDDLIQFSGLSLAEIEKRVIQATLESCNHNKNEAARILGIAEKSIYNKIKKHGVDTPIRKKAPPKKTAAS